MTANDRAATLKRVAELIKDIRTTMLMTLDETGAPRSRPMYTHDVEFDGDLWFMTGADTKKVQEIGDDPRVHLAYASRSSESYVSVTGEAEVLNDREKINEFWNPMLKAWWTGADDPQIRLIRVDVSRVEYWDTPGGRIASVLSLVKAAVTGQPDDSGENEALDLKHARSHN